MKVSCSPLEETEVRPATQILATAFRDDPFFGVILGGRTPSSWRHRLAYPAFFREAIRDALAGGRVDVARVDGRLADVAAWLRPVAPDDAPAHPRGARLGAAIDRLLVQVLHPGSPQLIDAGFTELAALHPTTAHWYLAFVGVEPAFQGRGVGRRLLRPVLELADATGTPCYLETQRAVDSGRRAIAASLFERIDVLGTEAAVVTPTPEAEALGLTTAGRAPSGVR